MLINRGNTFEIFYVSSDFSTPLIRLANIDLYNLLDFMKEWNLVLKLNVHSAQMSQDSIGREKTLASRLITLGLLLE
jgi:hypothetical protein